MDGNALNVSILCLVGVHSSLTLLKFHQHDCLELIVILILIEKGEGHTKESLNDDKQRKIALELKYIMRTHTYKAEKQNKNILIMMTNNGR